jgi:polyisoprenoid-binding protein YceI
VNRSRIPLAILPFAVILAVAAPLQTQQQLTFDPAHSDVRFTLGDVLHTVHGTFSVKQGNILFDPSGKASGDIVVDAASGNSGNSSRDRRITNDELKAASYNTVVFAPTNFTGALGPDGDSTLTVFGSLTLLGTPHAIQVPLKVHIHDDQVRVTGTFQVPFVQWGLKDPSTLMLRVNKEVQIDIDLSGTLLRLAPDGRPSR